MLDSIFEQGAAGETVMSMTSLLIALGISLVMGLIISFIFLHTTQDRIPSQGFALTLAILPAVITIIIMLVGSDIARAFSLAGAFSIIRFRSAPGSPKDITYVLMTMAVGLACGMGLVVYGAVMAAILCLFIIVLEKTGYGRVRVDQMILKITVPENLDYKDAFTPILNRYASSYTLNRIKTSNLGSLFELEYTLAMKRSVDEKKFVDELRVRNGNLNITLVMKAIASDY